jgi:hypothetical protein
MTTKDLSTESLSAQQAPALEAGCKTYSWTPEVHDFYGDAESVIRKMDTLPMELGDRRVYFLLVEHADGAEVRFFERIDDTQVAVLSWRGESAGDLKSRIADTILTNRGVNCVGAQTKDLIMNAVDASLLGSVPAPVSPRAAFSHTIRNCGRDKFMRATAGLLC